MALPEAGQAWPPPEWAAAFQQYRLNEALYAGDVEELHSIFAGSGAGGQSRGDSDAAHYNIGSTRRGGLRGLIDSIRTWWWGRSSKAGQSRTVLHSPLAGNLATLSADVLMSEPPAFRLIGADGKPLKENPAQDRLDDIMSSPEVQATLIQAAEYCAGLSAVALTVQWDADRTERPWLAVTACDAVVPEWEAGQVSAINLWTTHPQTNEVGQAIGVYYHVERHEVGRIVHALYLGNDVQIGDLHPLDELDATAYLAQIPGSLRGEDREGFTVILPTGLDRLTAAWWRNLPTRRFRRGGVLANLGRADTEGVEQFLDQVDMVWSSWMRDIKLARARLIVSSSMIDVDATGPTFDDDAEILRGLEFTTTPDDPPISAHQFAIRAEEHKASLLELTKEILNHAGYSLASYGEHGDGLKTATEVTDRKTATERTRDKKALYFRQAAEPLILAMLEVDRIHYGQTGQPADAKLQIVFPEQSQIDPETLARTLTALRTAMAASTKTLVAMLHPEWDADEVAAEVDEIRMEEQLAAELDPAQVGRDGEDPEDPDGETDPEADSAEEEPPADDDEQEAA